MKNRFKKLLGLGILAAVVIAAVPVVDVAAVGEANGQANASATVSEVNGSANHEHDWDIPRRRGLDSVETTCSRLGCDYSRDMRWSRVLRLRIIANDEEYSGKPYSRYWLEGKDEWLRLGFGTVENIHFYGLRGTEYNSKNPPIEVGTYRVFNRFNFNTRGTILRLSISKEFKIFSTEDTKPTDKTPEINENVNANGNMPVNDSQNSNIPAGNEPASQSSNIPESNMPTKPAFDSKVCMDKVKDMAGKEIKNQ